MNVWTWIALGWVALGVLINVASIGKKREPLTGGVVAGSLFFSAGFAWVIILASTTN